MEEHLFRMPKSDLTWFGNLKTFTCPTCGKSLMNFSKEEYKREFWCDDCGNNYTVEIAE